MVSWQPSTFKGTVPNCDDQKVLKKIVEVDFVEKGEKGYFFINITKTKHDSLNCTKIKIRRLKLDFIYEREFSGKILKENIGQVG